MLASRVRVSLDPVFRVRVRVLSHLLLRSSKTMQPAGGMAPPPMNQQHMAQPQQQWGMMAPPPPPQYQQPPPPMWGQQPPQIPPTQQQQQQQQYPAQYQAPQAQYQAPAAQPASSDEVRSLWIGDLQHWMDEAYLQSCFYQALQNGEVSRLALLCILYSESLCSSQL